MTREKIIALLGSNPPPGVLCSSDGAGEVNAAVFGSIHLLDDQHIAVGLGDNRTLDYLRKNPKATYIFYTPGKNPLAWQGARLYLLATAFENSGPLLERIVADTERIAGVMAAGMPLHVQHYGDYVSVEPSEKGF